MSWSSKLWTVFLLLLSINTLAGTCRFLIKFQSPPKVRKCPVRRSWKLRAKRTELHVHQLTKPNDQHAHTLPYPLIHSRLPLWTLLAIQQPENVLTEAPLPARPVQGTFAVCKQVVQEGLPQLWLCHYPKKIFNEVGVSTLRICSTTAEDQPDHARIRLPHQSNSQCGWLEVLVYTQ